ncbi:hypothetical protein [Streptomyces ipomoeae]|uniref:hypothetical protein n=1 Tax=Streptomyces ipomoeae TaxID=103232 RepID=UPI001146C096|nr:hypothetical protein [Streptomyces ipomoeae]MDX2932350.1 hypothetical protein [Streptomyces ipomoeae]TQE27052.1 hypothetical protein SipoB123_12785 [Streptomyces ipomoeae]
MNHPTGTGDEGIAAESVEVDDLDEVVEIDDTGRRLRHAFAEAAYDFTPPPVPLEAIERDGRRRRVRRRAAMVSTGCGLLLLPLVVLSFRPDGPSSSVQPMAPPAMSGSATPSSLPSSSPTPSPPAGKVRVLAPGERVTVEGGTQLWLTADGKHWRYPDPEPGVPPLENFRSVVDGNLDTSEPGISMQGSGSATGGYTVHGLFYGVHSAATRVEVTAYDGETINGTVLRLKGNTSWGVYAAHVKVPEALARSLDFKNPVRKVTVYDATGKVIAEMDFSM